jgi:hypothetical protein
MLKHCAYNLVLLESPCQACAASHGDGNEAIFPVAQFFLVVTGTQAEEVDPRRVTGVADPLFDDSSPHHGPVPNANEVILLAIRCVGSERSQELPTVEFGLPPGQHLLFKVKKTSYILPVYCWMAFGHVTSNFDKTLPEFSTSHVVFLAAATVSIQDNGGSPWRQM